MVSQGDPDGPRSDLSLLTDSLARIPDAQRRAIVLREWQGLPRQSIAAELGVSVGAVEKLILRARRALTEDLDNGARRRLPALASVAAWLRRYLHAGGVAKSAAGAASVAVLAAGTAHVVLPAHTPSSHTPARGVPHARSAVRVSDGPEASSPASVNLGARHRRRVAHSGGRAATPAVVPSYSGPSIAADDVEPNSAAAVVPAAPPEALPPTPASASAPTVAAPVADVPTDAGKAPAGADGPGRSEGNTNFPPGQDVRLLAAAIAGDATGSSPDTGPTPGNDAPPGLTDQPATSDDQAPAASAPPATDGAPGQTDQTASSPGQAPPAACPPRNGHSKAKKAAVPHGTLAS
jgi:hypothetical protein